MLNSDGYSQARNQIFIGARPLGLGETFTAIADDGNAVYWNPAGLPTLKRIEFNSMYANLYNIPGMKGLYLSAVVPLTPRYTVGASWFHLGFGDDELEYFRNKINLSFGARVYGNLSLGANFKYLNTDARLDGYSEGKGNGFGIDFGALYYFPLKNWGFLKQINLGLMTHDIGGTDLKYSDTDKSETVFKQNIRFGLSLFAKEEISLKLFTVRDALLAFDFDDRFHVGTEAWLFKILGLRAGLQKDFRTDESPTFSFGLSLKFPILSTQMDYSYLSPPTLASTNFFSFSFIRSLSPVKITSVSIDDLFASFYKVYATRPIGNVTLRNGHDEPLELTLKVSIPDLTESETHEKFVLEPDKERTLSFPAVFMKDILKLKESDFRQAQISIAYNIKGEDKVEETAEKFRLYGRGAITWDNPGKAAAFITKLDRMVELFALEAIKNLPYRTELELGNLYTAAALFDAMGAIGIRYREDPENPFSVIPKTQHSVDYIKYPAELLTNKQGDCDDLTVLFASLLEHCGIKTALVSTEGHIFLMFDTGIHERNWGLLPLGDSLVVVRDKTLWIPVEITEIGNSFAKAWQAGGKKYRTAEPDEEFEVVTVRDVEGVYLSALPEEFQNQIPEVPNEATLTTMMGDDFAWIQDRKTDFAIKSYLAELKKRPADISLRNELGIILAQQDSIEGAEAQFKNILRSQPENPQALVNLANVQCISGKFRNAEKNYLKATNLIGDEPGLYLNFAILYQLWKFENPADSTRLQAESESYLLHAFKLVEGNESQALDLLAISGEDIDLGEKADFRSWVKQQATEIKKFIKNNAKKYLFNKTVKGARLKRKAVKRGVDTDRRYILWWAQAEEA